MPHESELLSWLKTTLLFHNLSEEQCSSLLQISQVKTYRKDELIFRQGNDALGFYIIRTGRIKIFKVSANGKEQILNIFGVGENFAEVAALDGQPFPASAAPLEGSELLFFPRDEFLALLRKSPDISINMLISLSQHTRHLAGVIEALSFKDVPQRLASYLVDCCESIPLTDNAPVSNHKVVLDLTKTQLAATLGTIPATLSRAFYRLSNEDLIEVNGAEVSVLDRDRLQAFSKLLDS